MEDIEGGGFGVYWGVVEDTEVGKVWCLLGYNEGYRRGMSLMSIRVLWRIMKVEEFGVY